MIPFHVLVIILICLCRPSRSVPIDNDVEVEPQIVCGPGYIAVTFLLRNNFDGHVYVKYHYNESHCRSDQTGQRTASISVPFSTCGVQRTRSLNPKGVFVNTVIVITFHPKFITKVDRAYSFQCFYTESEKTVATQLDVSEMTSIFLTQRVPMPVCRYDVLDAQPPNGQPLKYAIVGQAVFHRWQCETDAKDIFCMNVNSCFVYDGLGDQAQLLDVNGCAVDRYLLQNIEYTTDLSAAREAHVFKFADRATVSFQCQIAITVREPTSACPRPACPSTAPPGAAPETAGSSSSRSTSTIQVAGVTIVQETQSSSLAIITEPSFPFTIPPFTQEPYRPTDSPSASTTSGTTSPTSGAFRTTSNASYRLVTAADDPLRDEAVQDSDDPIRRERSVTREELGVWDVSAKSISVFDLDDANSMKLKANGTGNSPQLRFGGGQLDEETEEPRYCFSLYSMGALMALAVLPSCLVILACLIRRLKYRSGRQY